jgi:hypothetical protein
MNAEEDMLTISRDGFDIFFAANKIRRRVELEAGDVDQNLLNEQLSILHYDIPSRGPSAGFSPCARLYQLAVPMSESVWLVRTGDVPQNYINEMLDMGCKVFPIKLDRSETAGLVAEALAFMQQKLQEKIAAAEKSMRDALAKLNRSEEEGISQEDATEAYERQAKVIEARLMKWQKDVAECNARFGINSNAYNISRLGERAAFIRNAMNEQAKAYSRATQALSQINTPDAQAAAQLAQQDQMPVAIMAEMLHDAGQSETAEQLQAAFAEPETFSLTGGDEVV